MPVGDDGRSAADESPVRVFQGQRERSGTGPEALLPGAPRLAALGLSWLAPWLVAVEPGGPQLYLLVTLLCFSWKIENLYEKKCSVQ